MTQPSAIEQFLQQLQCDAVRERYRLLHLHLAGAMCNAGGLIEVSNIVGSSIDHLEAMACGRDDGGVEVSVSALHLALSYIRFLEFGQLDAPMAGAA